MPIYEYKCLKCGSEFEKLVRSSSEEVACTECSAKKVERMLSVFAATASPKDGAGSCPVGETCPSAGARCCAGGSCGMH